MKTLDERIENDLKQIYENEIIPIKELVEKFKLSEAEILLKIFDSDNSDDSLSTHGMPGYFAGKRDAKTVMLMLNPGQDVAKANNPITIYEELKKKNINCDSLEEFIHSYKDGSRNYGKIDKERPDNFDLKQAAFLKPWVGCGVTFPKGFLDDNEKKIDSKSDIALEAKKNVLMQKLTIDLIPYASRKFDNVKSDKMELLFPYVETLFDEIFRVIDKRKYVIFCSALYEKLFRRYDENEEHPWGIKLDEKRNSDEILEDNVYCQALRIIRRCDGKSIKALIAHTFPNQALPNAYGLMEKYGEFCYDVFKNSKI